MPTTPTISPTSPHTARLLGGREAFWATPRFVAAAILAYLAAHFALRMAMWPTLGLDDAEQALFAQHFLWSYRFREPPLFTWLLTAVGGTIGVNAVSISLIRYALLGTTLGFTFLTARRLIADARLAALSTYSFAAIYVFAYYTHHDLTHTTAMSAALAAAWYVTIRLCETPRASLYALLGATCGLGLLAKWNFGMFAAALPLAAAALPAYRPLVLNRKALLAGAVIAVIVVPTVTAALWIGPAEGDSLTATLLRDNRGYPAAVLLGLVRLCKSVMLYPQPLLVLVLIIFGAALVRGIAVVRSGTTDGPPDWRLPAGTTAVSLALYLGLVIAFGANGFSERLMQPPLFILPVLLFWVIGQGRPGRRAITAFTLVLLLLAAGTFAARAVIYWRGADHCGSCRAMGPFEALGAQLRAAGFSGEGTIVTDGVESGGDGFELGGNARVVFPRARIVEPRFPLRTWPAAGRSGQCLLLWREDQKDSAATLSALERYLASQLNGTVAAPFRGGRVEAPMFGSKARTYALGYRLYDGANGGCR